VASVMIASVMDLQVLYSGHALAVALSYNWDHGRFADSAAKLEPVFGLQPRDQLLFQWTRTANYSAPS